MRNAKEAERFEDFDRAVVNTPRRCERIRQTARPSSSLDRAKLRASNAHYERGRRLAANNRFEEALLEYQLAAELNPTNADVERELTTTRNALRAKVAVAKEGQTALEALIDRTRDMPPAGHDLPEDVKLADSLIFGDASARAVFTTIARFANLNRRLRPRVPRRDDLDRPAQRDARGRAHVGFIREHADVLPGHRAAHDHDHPRHTGEAARVRGRGRPDVLSEQRRPQGDDRSPADRRRRPEDRADYRHERVHHQGHAGADRRRRHACWRDRQGTGRGRHRRRAAGGRSHASCTSTGSRSRRPASPGSQGASTSTAQG